MCWLEQILNDRFITNNLRSNGSSKRIIRYFEIVKEGFTNEAKWPLWCTGVQVRPLCEPMAYSNLPVTWLPYGTSYLHGGNNGNFQSSFMIDRARKNRYVFFTNSDRGHDLNQKLEAFFAKTR